MRVAPRSDGVVEDVRDEHGDLPVVGDSEDVEVDRVVAGRSGLRPRARCRPPRAATLRDPGRGDSGGLLGLGSPGRRARRPRWLSHCCSRLFDLEEVGDRYLLFEAECVGEPRQTGDEDLGFGAAPRPRLDHARPPGSSDCSTTSAGSRRSDSGCDSAAASASSATSGSCAISAPARRRAPESRPRAPRQARRPRRSTARWPRRPRVRRRARPRPRRPSSAASASSSNTSIGSPIATVSMPSISNSGITLRDTRERAGHELQRRVVRRVAREVDPGHAQLLLEHVRDLHGRHQVALDQHLARRSRRFRRRSPRDTRTCSAVTSPVETSASSTRPESVAVPAFVRAPSPAPSTVPRPPRRAAAPARSAW